MGGSRYDAGTWDGYHSAATRGGTAPISAAFVAKGMKDSLDPAKIAVRESRDSTANPNSTPIIVDLDVTGSMGMLAHTIANSGFKTLFEAIYDRKPVTDPHIMFMANGDVAASDRAPLQVSQFEADIKLAEQLLDIYLEGGGGGNNSESYTLPWYFAAMKVSADAIEKRGKKGYLFTVGDELCPQLLRASELERVFGPGQYSDLSTPDLLDMVSRNWNVFHIVALEGSYTRSSGDRVMQSWRDVLGQRVLPLTDHTKLAEVIVSAIQVVEGEAVADVAKSWGGDTSVVVASAVRDLAVGSKPGAGNALVHF